MNQMTRIAAAPPASFPTSFKARFTTAEFLRMTGTGAFSDMKLELIEGELERMTPPTGSHVKRQSDLFAALLRAVAGSGITVGAEVGIALDEDTAVAADIALIGTTAFEARYFTPAEVLLVAEIAETTLNRDLGPKRTLYAKARIAEYWVVDGARSATHVHREPIDGDYADTHTVRFGQPLAVPGTDATVVLS